MKSMTIEELYDHLNSPEFQQTQSDIFYNYYIYLYPPQDEYKMRDQIQEFKERLKRPTSFVNALTLDLFDAFCDYLKEQAFGPDSLLDVVFEQDKQHPEAVTELLTSEANSDRFFKFIHDRIAEHIKQNDGLKKPYVFIYGIGKIFPYLRTNVFLTAYEPYNDTDKYKIILFYPGGQEGNSFTLFNALQDHHTYRAILLVNE